MVDSDALVIGILIVPMASLSAENLDHSRVKVTRVSGAEFINLF